MNGLRIGWAAPWNDRSASAQSAAEVAFALSRLGHDVCVLRTEVGDALAMPPRPAPGPIRSLAETSSAELARDFDVVVAHFGDNFGFHGALPRRLGDVEMVGIFHDCFVANLASQTLGGSEQALRALLRDTYGEDTWPPDRPFFEDMGDLARRRPLLEWLGRQVVGAVVHAEHYAARVRDACPGPVAVIPLAFSVPDPPPPPGAWSRMTVAVVGHANPNKRIDQLIMAVGASPLLRSRCRIRIIGDVTGDERGRLDSLARAVRIEPPRVTGWVSDAELRWQLRDVDVVSCLRNPILEGASASLVLAQLSGRPILVTGHGSYTELPADTVLSCSPEHEARDVMRHLEALLKSPDRGHAIGQRARVFALQNNAPAAYANRLAGLLHQVIGRQPQRLAERQLTGTLTGFGLSAHDPSVRRVQNVLAGLLGASQGAEM